RRRLTSRLAAWLPVWAGFALPLLAWTVAAGLWLEGALLLGQAALGLAAGALMGGSPRAARTGLLVALGGLALAGGVGAWMGPRSLRPYEGATAATRVGASGV